MKSEIKKGLVLVVKYYATNYKLTKGTGTKIALDGASKTALAFKKLFVSHHDKIIEHCGRRAYSELEMAIEENIGLRASGDIQSYIAEQVYTLIQSRLNRQHIDDSVKNLKKMEGFSAFSYENLIPIIDISTNQKVMFDTEELKVLPEATHEAYDHWLKLQDKEVKEVLNSKAMPALVRYNPEVSGGTTEEQIGNQKVTCVNSHTKPSWREKEIQNPKLPKEFKQLMEHLFPNEECREYIYFYMYNMLMSRNPMHLLLHGARGIGKNSLVEIMAALVGHSNYYAVPKEFWDNNFNGELRHRRLIYFDEHVIKDKTNLSQLKILSDDFISYHVKFSTIQGLERNHASHIISNNLEEVNQLVQESRRFSVPVLTHENLTDAWGADKIEELWELKKEDEWLGNLGWWIIENGNSPKFHRDRPYKSEAFYEIVNKALFPWKAWIIETIESRETDMIRIKDFQDDKLSYRGVPIGRQKIQNFLNSHKDMDGDYYATIKTIDGDRWIVPTAKYLPESSLDSPIEDDFTSMEF